MGYHIQIIRSGQKDTAISEEEVESVVGGRFGFTIVRDDSGTISDTYKEIDGDNFVLSYAPPERLWAKPPTEAELQLMLDIAKVLGNNARVRGDEFETYETIDKTYTHPDDAALIEEPSVDWKGVLSRAPTVIIFIISFYYSGKLLLRYLSKHVF